MIDDKPAIVFENVSFSYGGLTVLEDVDLTIGFREFACIVGPNGGGKTTLVKLTLGLLKPETGTVRLFGSKPAGVRSRVGYMPQHVHLDPKFPVSVMDVVLMGRLGNGHTFGPYRGQDKLAARKALREVGLFDKRDQPFAELSGGQQRRLFIARAIACEPELLILDEPTANLDPKVEQELYQVLNELNQRMAVVVVSHDMTFVSQFVERVICVKRGVHIHPTSEIRDGTLSEVFGMDVRLVRHDRHAGE
ncbi:metal ABC transporter ATP-binding protein [Candidatus Zixiibacteriota bacterium]